MSVLSLGTTIYAGATPIMEMTTADPSGDAETPSAITVVHRPPSGTEVTYSSPTAEITLGADSTVGLSRFIFPTGLVAGKHVVHVRATGTATTAAKTLTFDVKPDGTTTL